MGEPTAAQTFDGDVPWRERTNVHRVREAAAKEDAEAAKPELWIRRPAGLLVWPLRSEDVWPFGGSHARPPVVRVNALARMLLLSGIAGSTVWGRAALYLATATAVAVALVQESAEERWRVLAERRSPLEAQQLAQMQKPPAEIGDHALKGVNTSPFDYGKTFCADMPSDAGADDPDPTYSTGEANLGLFIHQVPDPTGCGRSPFFGDLPPVDPVGPERNCAYRQCR